MSKFIKFLWLVFFLALLSIVALFSMANYGVLGEMPKIEDLENPRSALASEIYCKDGSLLGKYYLENRLPCARKDISPNIIDALVSTEDERFYDHSGIDAEAIGRALSGVVTLKNKGGASTITQQLAKALLKQGSKNIFDRLVEKIKEQIVAVKLERNLTKDEIITQYLNFVPFGENAYGIRAATKTYFNKEPMDVSVEEAAVLVGLLKANTTYNPRKHPEASKGRRNVVLQKMVDNGKLSGEVAAKLKELPVVVDFQTLENYQNYPAPYFRQVVENDVKDWCKKTGYNIYRDGLKIYTTLDTTMQKYAELAVARHAPFLSRGRGTWRWAKKPKYFENELKKTDRFKAYKDAGLSVKAALDSMKRPVKMKIFTWNGNHEKDTTISPIDSFKIMRSYVQTGFMAMDPASGEVKAWVGGINHKFFKYDHVNYNTKRQVGSTMKPLLYCLAVDNGYSPCTPISCRPVFFPGHRLYNAGGSSKGTLPMKNVLAYSINNGALAILKMVGIPAFVDFSKKCGIISDLKEYPSIALGACEISIIEMLRAYTMFPNYGVNTKPIYITRIEDRNGNVLENFVPERTEVINEQTAYKMIRMMQGTTSFGTGKSLKPKFGISGEVAGKTGTTNDEADAWFIGYTPQLLGGCWVGCEDRFIGLGIGEGAKAAMPIWGSFFKMVQNNSKLGYADIKEFEEPMSMEGVDICDNTDRLSDLRSGSLNSIRSNKTKKRTKSKEKKSENSSASSGPKVVAPVIQDNNFIPEGQ